jgi:hypothetical protein
MHGSLPQDRRNFSIPGTPDYSGSQGRALRHSHRVCAGTDIVFRVRGLMCWYTDT